MFTVIALIIGLSAGGAEAQTAPIPTLPQGVTFEQAMQAVANGSASNPEVVAYLLGEAQLLVSAGVPVSTALTTVEGQLSAQQVAQVEAYYGNVNYGPALDGQIVSDGEVGSAGATEAGDTTAEVLGLESDAGVIPDVGADFAGAVCGSVAIVCAAAIPGVSLGVGIDYALGVNDFADASSESLTSGSGDTLSLVSMGRDYVKWPTVCPSSGYEAFPNTFTNVVTSASTPFPAGFHEYIGSFGTVACVPGEAGMYVLVSKFSNVLADGTYGATTSNSGSPSTGTQTFAGGWMFNTGSSACVGTGEYGPVPAGAGSVVSAGTVNGAESVTLNGQTWAFAQHGWTLIEAPEAIEGTHGSCYYEGGGSSPNNGVMDGVSVEPDTAIRLTQPKTSCPSNASCTAVADNPSSGWQDSPSQLASLLASPGFGDVVVFLTSEFGGTTSNGSQVAAPGAIAVPNVAGMSLSAAESALTAAGFTGGYTSSVDQPAAAVKSDGVNNVTFTTPASGTSVDPSTSVELFLNPASFPVTVPAWTSGETATQYQQALVAAGITGTITLAVVSDENESASAGPNGVVTLNDTTTGATGVVPGSTVQPGDSLTIEENPGDAPAVGAVGTPSGDCGLTAPTASPNFSPITSLGLGSVFPFSIIPWLQSLVGTAPSSQRPDLPLTVFGSTIDTTAPLGSTFDPIFSDIRSTLAVLLWIGALLLLYRRITGAF